MKIQINNLAKSYNEQNIFKDFTFNLTGYNSVAIIGPSGGGKSTLLRILGGLEKPDSGRIEINSHKIDYTSKKNLDYKKKIAVVFQSYNLFPHLSILQNIILPLTKVHKLSKIRSLYRAVKLLKRFKLYEHCYKKPHQLSGGQKQRVAIVRALALKPEIMLLDEPTSALDPVLTSEVLTSIEEVKKISGKFIIVTHEIGFAKKVADYVLFIDNGEVIEHGLPEILEMPKTKKLQKFLRNIL